MFLFLIFIIHLVFLMFWMLLLLLKFFMMMINSSLVFFNFRLIVLFFCLFFFILFFYPINNCFRFAFICFLLNLIFILVPFDDDNNLLSPTRWRRATWRFLATLNLFFQFFANFFDNICSWTSLLIDLFLLFFLWNLIFLMVRKFLFYFWYIIFNYFLAIKTYILLCHLFN